MCDPVTLGLGIAASVGGSLLNSNNAADKAQAANASLAKNVGKLNTITDSSEKSLGDNLANYGVTYGPTPGNSGSANVTSTSANPNPQATQLADAQTARGDTNTGNISTPEESGENDIPVTADAPAAVKSEIAKRMLAAHDMATGRAKALGTLGGYGDTWLTNNLANAETGYKVNANNTIANGIKGIIGPEQQLAMAGTGNSPLGSILEGVGSILGSAAGSPTSTFTSTVGNKIGSLLPFDMVGA